MNQHSNDFELQAAFRERMDPRNPAEWAQTMQVIHRDQVERARLAERHKCLINLFQAFNPTKTWQEAEAFADETMERQRKGSPW